jgi:biotin carboxyl carrier protein
MKLRITVEGKSYDVDVEVLDDHVSSFPAPSSTSSPVASVMPVSVPQSPSPSPSKAPSTVPSISSSERAVKAPIVGTIIQVKVAPGDSVVLNQVVLVMEAMKMETNVASPFAGKVKAVCISTGDAVKAGQVLIELE